MASTSSNSEPHAPNEDQQQSDNSRFECNICLDVATDAVVSLCGHLFCWPCLVQWLDTRPHRQQCPVCKSAINRDKVVPLYGRGGDNKDPRDKVPPRPQGQRSEAPQPGFSGVNWGGDGAGGVQFSFGIGVFPISFMASWFSNGANGGNNNRNDRAQPGSRQYEDEQFLSNIFMILGIFFIVWLLVV